MESPEIFIRKIAVCRIRYRVIITVHRSCKNPVLNSLIHYRQRAQIKPFVDELLSWAPRHGRIKRNLRRFILNVYFCS